MPENRFIVEGDATAEDPKNRKTFPQGAPKVPLSDLPTGPTQVTGVQTDREVLANAASAIITIGAGLMPGYGELKFPMRMIAAFTSGAAGPIGSAVVRDALGLPQREDPGKAALTAGLFNVGLEGAGSLVTGGLGKLAPRRLDPVMKEARGLGLETMSIGQASGGPVIRGLEKTAERTPSGRAIVNEMRQRQVGEMMQAVEKIGTKYSAAQTRVEAGRSLQQMLDEAESAATAITKANYAAIDAKTGGIPSVDMTPETGPIAEKISSHISRVAKHSPGLAAKSDPYMRILSDFNTKLPKRMTVMDAHELRSEALSLLRNAPDEHRDVGPLLKQLIPGMDRAMMKGAAEHGVEAELRDADAFHKRFAEVFRSDLIKKVEDRAPEKLAAMIGKDDVSGMGIVKDALDHLPDKKEAAERFREVKKAWFFDKMKGFRDGIQIEADGTKLGKSVEAMSAHMRGDGSEISKQFFNTPEDREFLQNMNTISEASKHIGSMAKADPAAYGHVWGAVHYMLPTALYMKGHYNEAALAFFGPDAAAAMLTRIAYDKRATKLFTEGLQGLTDGTVGRYIKPRAAATIFRAANEALGLRERLFDEPMKETYAGPVQPSPLPPPTSNPRYQISK